MSELPTNESTSKPEVKKNSNYQAVIILIVFIVMFVGLVAYEIATRK